MKRHICVGLIASVLLSYCASAMAEDPVFLTGQLIPDLRLMVGKPLLAPEDPKIVAVASDAPLTGLKVPLLPIDDARAIADFIAARLRLPGAA